MYLYPYSDVDMKSKLKKSINANIITLICQDDTIFSLSLICGLVVLVCSLAIFASQGSDSITRISIILSIVQRIKNP